MLQLFKSQSQVIPKMKFCYPLNLRFTNQGYLCLAWYRQS